MMPEQMLVWLVDGVLLVAVLEGVWLLHRARRAGLARLPLAANLGAGLALMVALRCVLANVSWPWVLTCLTIAGLAHALDMRARWRAAPGPASSVPDGGAPLDAPDSRRPPPSAQPPLLQPSSHR